MNPELAEWLRSQEALLVCGIGDILLMVTLIVWDYLHTKKLDREWDELYKPKPEDRDD